MCRVMCEVDVHVQVSVAQFLKQDPDSIVVCVICASRSMVNCLPLGPVCILTKDSLLPAVMHSCICGMTSTLLLSICYLAILQCHGNEDGPQLLAKHPSKTSVQPTMLPASYVG